LSATLTSVIGIVAVIRKQKVLKISTLVIASKR